MERMIKSVFIFLSLLFSHFSLSPFKLSPDLFPVRSLNFLGATGGKYSWRYCKHTNPKNFPIIGCLTVIYADQETVGIKIPLPPPVPLRRGIKGEEEL
jgi:hypothetical protein